MLPTTGEQDELNADQKKLMLEIYHWECQADGCTVLQD